MYFSIVALGILIGSTYFVDRKNIYINIIQLLSDVFKLTSKIPN